MIIKWTVCIEESLEIAIETHPKQPTNTKSLLWFSWLDDDSERKAYMCKNIKLIDHYYTKYIFIFM